MIKLSSRLLATAAALTLASVSVSAAPPSPSSSSAPAQPLPSPLKDIGAQSACPIILVEMGQSNKEGFDNGGDKTVQPGIYITNSLTAPTAIVPVAFGTAPLNQGTTDGVNTTTVSTAAAAYNNSGVWFANYLKLAGLANNRDIVIIPNWFPGQSIKQWVGTTPGTMDTTAPYWQYLTAQFTYLQTTKYANCPISQVDWDQGEADSTAGSTGYNSTATYKLGFSTLLTAVKGLSAWNANGSTVWSGSGQAEKPSQFTVQELAKWAFNGGSNWRNDVIETYRGGKIDPRVDVVGVDNLVAPDGTTGAACESTQNPGPHFKGQCLQTIGSRLFSSYLHTRVGGAYADRDNGFASNGSADAYPNVINGPAAASGTCSISGTTMNCTAVTGTIRPGQNTVALGVGTATSQSTEVLLQLTGTTGGVGTYQVSQSQTLASETINFGLALGVSDIGSGALIIANGGVLSFPQPAFIAYRPVKVTVYGAVATYLDFAGFTGTTLGFLEQNGTQNSIITANAGSVYEMSPINGYWRVSTRYPFIFGNPSFTGGATLTDGSGPDFRWINSGAAADTKEYTEYVGTDGTFHMRATNDAFSAQQDAWAIYRTGYANLSFVHFTPTKFNKALGLTAAGTTLATALALTADINEVTTAASGTGVVLASYNTAQGGIQKQEVLNAGANTLNVYPPVSTAAIRILNGSTAAQAAGAAATLAVGSHGTFECVSATLCYEAP